MNIYFILAGAFGFLGGCAHSFLGHKWTINAIDTTTLNSTQNTQIQDKRFLVWFWHVGSIVLLSTSILLFVHGADWFNIHFHLLTFISFLWLCITLLFIIIAAQRPSQILRMIPGLIGIPINILILLGIWS